MWESENQDESPLMTTDNFHGIDRLEVGRYSGSALRDEPRLYRCANIAYLGHRNIQHTVRYTELSPTLFKDFWRQ